MNDEEDNTLLVEPPTEPTPTEPVFSAQQVQAALDAERAKLGEAIAKRDEEWNAYLAEQNEPDPDPERPIDINAIRQSATKEAVAQMNAVQNTKEAILDKCRSFGPEGEKMARQAIESSSVETLADPRNARVISALIRDELIEKGKMPTTGPNAANNAVQGDSVEFDGLADWERAFGKMDAETKAAFKAAGAI